MDYMGLLYVPRDINFFTHQKRDIDFFVHSITGQELFLARLFLGKLLGIQGYFSHS